MDINAVGKSKASVALVVTTRDGKRYNLGCQKEGLIKKPLSKFMQDMRIRYYVWSRLRDLTDPKEIAEFKELMRQR